MRLQHHIKDHNKPEFTAALDKLGIRYKTKVIGGVGHILDWNCFELSVFDDDPKWPILRDIAAEFDVQIYHRAIYTSADLRSAEWLLAHAWPDAGTPQPRRNWSYYSVIFDLTNYCKRCNVGWIQKQPFRFNSEPKNKTSHFFSTGPESQVIFVRPEVQAVFEAENVSGIQYIHPLKHRTGLPLEAIVQIFPITALRNGLVTAVQEPVTCKPNNEELQSIKTPSFSRGEIADGYCGRVKYHFPYRRRITHFQRDIFENVPDVVLSAEWFGSGGKAAQQIIVSNKVARLVLAHKWKGLELEPIQLV